MTSSARDATKKTTKLRVRDYLEDDSWNEYLIVGRPLPTGYFENYDTDEINTTIENVIHMMTLVACYLGIKLPFDTFTRSSKYYIQAAFTAGSKRAPLFLSENNIIAFAAGLGHLNYNIAFLCHSQGVHITLANATNTLENLLACCEAPSLGRYTNYASFVTKKPEDKSAGTHYSDLEDSTISPGSDDGDFETIDPYLRTRAPNSSKAQELNENVLWCPGQEPFDLNVHDLISVIRRRREEESPVWGGLHLQDAVAGNLNPHEDDYFMHEDQEEEDGMAPSSMNRGPGTGSGILGGRGWPDISKLKQIGSAVGGAAVGLVNGAANVGRGSFSSGQSSLHRDETSTGGGSRRGSEMSPTSRAHLRGYPTISSSAPS
ncbi:hypothetical protein BG006_002216 [Podila minutissima]|uniref:Autophagy-related protein 14 n=1 Tax=Podila minutissima TaxID=64525 RepID=A0A9P5VQU3_9FUNG|nr:hypothetical protein BG006_002216 [Podila minutissima]